VHHAKPVKASWLAEHADAIEVFYLPSYSPELNLDEMPTPTSSKPSPSWLLRARNCNWSRPPHATCAACNGSPSGFESTSSMDQFAMRLDSSLLIPTQ